MKHRKPNGKLSNKIEIEHQRRIACDYDHDPPACRNCKRVAMPVPGGKWLGPRCRQHGFGVKMHAICDDRSSGGEGMSDLDLRDAVDRAIKALEPVSRYRAVNGDDWPALKVRPVLDMLRAALAQPQDRPRTEQDAWEEWAQTTRPSGDVDEVQRKWLASAERAAFLEESEQTQAQAEPAAWWVPSFSEPLVGIGPKKPMLWPEAQPLYSNQPVECARCGHMNWIMPGKNAS